MQTTELQALRPQVLHRQRFQSDEQDYRYPGPVARTPGRYLLDCREILFLSSIRNSRADSPVRETECNIKILDRQHFKNMVITVIDIFFSRIIDNFSDKGVILVVFYNIVQGSIGLIGIIRHCSNIILTPDFYSVYDQAALRSAFPHHNGVVLRSRSPSPGNISTSGASEAKYIADSGLDNRYIDIKHKIFVNPRPVAGGSDRDFDFRAPRYPRESVSDKKPCARRSSAASALACQFIVSPSPTGVYTVTSFAAAVETFRIKSVAGSSSLNRRLSAELFLIPMKM